MGEPLPPSQTSTYNPASIARSCTPTTWWARRSVHRGSGSVTPVLFTALVTSSLTTSSAASTWAGSRQLWSVCRMNARDALTAVSTAASRTAET